MSERGKLIGFELGIDGVGKTTQAKMLASRLSDEGRPSVYVHEPGDEPDRMSNEIEDIMEFVVKSKDVDKTPREAFLAFTIGRLATYRKKIKPRLDNGDNVIFDRNWLSSVVYQGHADGIGIDFIREETARYMPEEYMYPDFTFLIQSSEEHRQKLLRHRNTSDKDFFESREDDFQSRLREGASLIEEDENFVRFHKKIGNQTIKTAQFISFDGTIEDIHERVFDVVQTKIFG
jgi:dTMP kinase